MSEGKQRSGIFKFLYIVLSIVTFPIFMILFILRHPFWILFLLCLAAGGVAYYPLSQGVKPEEVISWYQKKYQDIKFEVVTNAVESGKTDFIPQAIVDEVVKTKQKMEEDKEEAARPKSENYNENISRDKKVEEVKQDLKKRKSGFKRKGSANDVNNAKNSSESLQNPANDTEEQKSDTLTLDVETLSGGGLAGVLGIAADNEQKQPQSVSTSEVQENNVSVSAPGVVGKNDLDVLEQPKTLSQKENIPSKSEKMEVFTPSRDESGVIPQSPSTEKVIPSLLPNKVEDVSAKVEQAVENSSDDATVPTLLLQEDKVVLSGDVLVKDTEKREGGKSLNTNQGEKLSPQIQTQQQVRSQPAVVTEGNDVPMLLPNTPSVDNEAKENEAEKVSQSQPVDDIFSDEDFEDLKLF